MTRPELLKLFRECASEVAEKDHSHVTEETPLSSLGIDSLAMLELVGQMERQLETRIPEEQLTGVQALGEYLDVVETCLRDPKLRISTAKRATL